MSDREQRQPDELGADEEFEAVVGQLDALERSRRLRTAIAGLAVLAVLAGLVWWMAQHTDDLFRPNIDIEEGEMELLEDTGDPTCRTMIAGVRRAAEDFGAVEFDFEDEIWGDDEDRVYELSQKATEFRNRLATIEEEAEDAVYREENIPGHPPVPAQVEEWFGNMDNEFRILEEMADKRLRILRDEEVAERGGMWENPPNLRDTVLMTIDENFEEFRVWVIRGGHPCGPPPEGVDPWEPEDDEDLEGIRFE